jgi:hypothetical protein
LTKKHGTAFGMGPATQACISIRKTFSVAQMLFTSLCPMADVKRVDSDALSSVQLKKVDTPVGDRPLPSAAEIEAARKLAEVEPEPVPKELLPKTGDGQTHLDLIKGGAAALKKVDAPGPRPLPTAEEIEAARKLAEAEPEPVPKELLPKTGDGQTHLDLIKAGAAELKKVAPPPDRPLPTAEELAVAKAAESS